MRTILNFSRRLTSKRLLSLCAIICLGASCVWAQRFAILSDVHVSPGNANEKQLKLAVEEINNSDAQVVMMTGDLTNEGSDEQLRNIKSILDGINKPLYVIPGNHENNWSQSACKTFVDLWGNDRFVFEIDSLVVIGLNCGPFMKMGDGHVKQEDLSWLEQELKARVTPGKRVLSVNHYPLKDDLDNYAAYHEILRKYPVVAHQNGHYHHWDHYVTGGINGVMVRALDMRNGDYGYSLLEVRGDSTLVWEKRIGAEPQLKYAFERDKEAYQYTIPTPVFTPEQNNRLEVALVHRDEATIFTRLTIDKNNIYFGNSLGYAKAINKSNDKTQWTFKTDAMLFSRIAVDGKVAVVPTADKRLLWLDKTSGALLKEVASAGPYVADGVVSHGILYQGGYKKMEAWDIKHGKLLWRNSDINNYCQASPVVDGNDVIFGAWDTKLRCLDKRTGKLVWSWDNGKTANLFSPGNVVPVVTKKRVLIVAPDRHSSVLDRKTGKEVWRHFDKNVKVRESLGRNSEGSIAYAKTMDGTLVAMDTRENDYKELWNEDLGFGYEHAPCIVLEHKGLIFTGSRRGKLTVLDAATHQVVCKQVLGTSEVNGFEIDPTTGDVYCSLIEGTIFRLKVKK